MIRIRSVCNRGSLMLLTLFISAAVLPAAQFQPPQTHRVKVNINQDWKFNRSDVSGAQATTFNDAAWSTVHLPHNFQKVSIANSSYYRGVGWYRRHFTLDESYRGKQITLYFEGAMTVAQVYINGTALAAHYGGFSPFCFNITESCTFGATENVVAVKLTNAYQSQVPPEKPDKSSVDFEMFGGIYRDVWLIATDNIFVPEGIHAWADTWKNQGGHFITTPTVSAGSAVVNVQTWVKNATTASVNANVITTITDAANAIVQTDTSAAQAVAAGGVTGFTQNLTVAGPTLWNPWAPYRYSVHTVVRSGTVIVDYYQTRIGIRKIEFNKTTGAFCNGTYFKMLGLNRHQMWPFVGNAVPDIQQRRDAEMLKDAGCNFVRCSHYQQDDAFIDACDSLGLCVWEEIPGWHCCNGDPSGFPSSDATWRARHFDALKAMVRSLRNHPSIVIWGPGINEAVSDPDIEKPLNDTCHKEDPTRATSVARAGWQHPTGAGKNIYDVYGDNQFTPGSIPTSNPDPNTSGYINTEHTGHTYEDYSNRATNSESDLLSHAWKHAQMTGEARDRGTWVLGGMGWCMFDYYTGGTIRVHGVMDLMHIPKFAFWFYKSQSASDNYNGVLHPFLKIANWYTKDSPVNRDVYHNCEQVKLYRNGTLVATQGPAKTLNLAHGVTTFEDIAFETGMLTAEGLIGGAVVARDTVRTPGTAASVKLIADPPVIEANGGDFSRIEAYIIDANGTWVPKTKNSVSFTISGPGELVGDNPIAAQSGACIVLAKAGLSSGVLTVTASSSNLTNGTVEVTVRSLPVTGTIGYSTGIMKGIQTRHFEKTFTIIGNRFTVPAAVRGKKVTVVVYDLSGKVVYRNIVDKQLADVGKLPGIADGIRIVRLTTMP